MLKRPLTQNLHVANQIKTADLEQIAQQGFTTIINNRPDDEARNQATANEMAAAARKLGINYIYQPVDPGNVTADDAATFGKLIDETPGKILAHCRTGTRSTMLWALSQSGKQPVDTILAAASKAGYDLESLRTRLR